MDIMDYVRNAWYVAGWASEFGDDLCRVTILEENLVMYRTSAGTVVAMEDRCPHRFLPLSRGKRIGDDIQCGYHGMTFDCRGECVRVPGQDGIPAQAYVETFAVHEKHQIVWVWMGDREKADIDAVFDMPEFDDPTWHAHQGGQLHLKSNYLNVAENLVDPAHVSFVHPTTLGSAAGEEVPVQISIKGEPIVAWRWIRNAPAVGFFQEYGGFSGNVDRWHYYYLYMPCTAVIDFGSAATEDKLDEQARDQGVRIFAFHFMTPVNAHYTIDRWMHLRNRAIDDEAVSRKMDDMFTVAFAEDKIILEAVQEEENRPAKRPAVRIGIDKGPNAYRKRIDRLIAHERAAAR
jgi:vanillate O-demethylase monooxygenase subunit